MWELDHKEDWGLENWCLQTVVLEKTLESPLDCMKIKSVNPKGNQPWIFIGRILAEAEAPMLWPPDVMNWLLEKTLIWVKIKSRRRGWQMMRWLNGITNSMDMSLSNPGIWWWTGKSGLLQSVGYQKVVHDWATELNCSTGSLCSILIPLILSY